MAQKTATQVRKNLPSFNGTAHLYLMDPPLDGNEYVIVSATTLPFLSLIPDMERDETYIFPATGSGEVADWGELDGSMKGTLDHSEALAAAGYEVTA